MEHEEYFDFPVVHAPFYTEFEAWRFKKNKESVLKEGIYYLLADKPIPRCLKEDSRGILYIGKGMILQPRHRLGKLINSINQTEAMHEAGVRYNRNALSQKYRLENIKLRIVLSEKPRELESKLLGLYIAEFGELPPLNHQQ
jgi:hypothetical protein